jgi:hypothetical protein
VIDMILEKLDPATEQSIIQEIRQAVKNAIIQTRETNIGFGDLDFMVDDFVDFDLPDDEYSAMQEACDMVAFNEFTRMMTLLKEAFGVEGME